MKRRRVVAFFLVAVISALVVFFAFEAYGGIRLDERIAACRKSDPCLTSLAESMISEEGLDAGFSALQDMYAREPVFRQNCSAAAMRLADYVDTNSADPSSIPLSPVLAACNYGFLQQYPVDLLLASKDPGQAQAFCARVAAAMNGSVPAAESECYRGIGRGLPLISGARANDQETAAAFALAQCKALAPNTSDYEVCVSGLFNSIGRSSTSDAYGFSLVTNDPMRLCQIQTDPDARSRCFGNYKATVISMVNVYDPVQAQQDIMRLYGPGASSTAGDALWTIGYEWANNRLVGGGSISATVAACASLGEPFVHNCVQGVSVGIAKNGVPWGQTALLTGFCEAARTAIPGLVQGDCPSLQAVGYLRGFYSPQHFLAALASMEQVLGPIQVPPPGYGY